MSSLIPGFDYDIFISNDQKDYKYVGLVTEFVDNHKGVRDWKTHHSFSYVAVSN
jgi:hypothetical protein